MDSFPVSPEDCLILRALQAEGSLRGAARLLQCDPAGLLRKVARISAETGLVQKASGKWHLTNEGMLLVGWIGESILSQKKLLQQECMIRVSCTLWMAEQFVIPHVRQLLKRIPGTTGIQVSGTESDFENELLRGQTDFVVVCHPPNDPAIAHKNIAPEKWVVIVPREWMGKGGPKSVSDLVNRPFVRHKDLNPDLLLPSGMLLRGDPRIVMDSLIGVRSAVSSGLGWSYVPKIAAADTLASGKVVSIQHEFEMARQLSVWWLRHVKRSKENASLVCSWAKEICRKF